MIFQQNSKHKIKKSQCAKYLHTRIKGKEEANKATKQAIDMPGIASTRLPHADYYLTIKRARNSE